MSQGDCFYFALEQHGTGQVGGCFRICFYGLLCHVSQLNPVKRKCQTPFKTRLTFGKDEGYIDDVSEQLAYWRRTPVNGRVIYRRLTRNQFPFKMGQLRHGDKLPYVRLNRELETIDTYGTARVVVNTKGIHALLPNGRLILLDGNYRDGLMFIHTVNWEKYVDMMDTIILDCNDEK